MKKRKRTIRMIACVLLIGIGLVACNRTEKKLIGEWTFEDVDGEAADMMELDYYDYVVEFKEDGKVKFCQDDDCKKGKWDLEDDVITIKLEDDIKVKIEIDEISDDELEGEMTLYAEDEKVKGDIELSKGGKKKKDSDADEDEADDEDYYSDDEDIYNEGGDDTYSYGSEDWDEILDSYEEYIDQCVVLMEDVGKGDQAAVTEYMELTEKAAELSEKMDASAGDGLSADQLSRYMEISTKLTTAAAEMYQ